MSDVQNMLKLLNSAIAEKFICDDIASINTTINKPTTFWSVTTIQAIVTLNDGTIMRGTLTPKDVTPLVWVRLRKEKRYP